ncbi:PhzF family phenazine biosynthesis isomerase [Bacillus suaedaesalsae]|uniref:PhzF family phenazine biosynthesis protein n=1 Tax=Bacillus suaedaesalsae TaxID=2810349 RepID=A0ABS2DHG8_9BACI|nr:PhzF family phenazine biosynthesis protein [Bacillus suaedaesalsae]
MECKVYTLNAFTKQSKGGNPAGVVLQSDFLSDEQMQTIARKVGFSETAFVQHSKVADYMIRYFTPVQEVDLCGHATIAAFQLIRQTGVGNGIYKIETKAGILEVVIESEYIYLSQALPTFDKVIEPDEIVQSLYILETDLNLEFPIQIVSTGLRDIIIPIKNKEILHNIQPNFQEITTISKKYNVIGYHLFTLDTERVIASCRNFAPLYDILEESATGTSNGALTCYLHKYKALGSGSYLFVQGEAMQQSSLIITRLLVNTHDSVDRIEVGGTAGEIQIQHIEI